MGRGRRGMSHFVVAFLIEESAADESGRLGIVASRKVGNSVVRNRTRRRLRELWRRAAPRPKGDLVLLARPGSGTATWADLRRSFHRALRRAQR